MLVFMLQKILSLLGLLGQNIMLLFHSTEQKKDYGTPHMPHNLCSIFPSTVCLYTACKFYAHAPLLFLCFLVNFKRHLFIGLEYELKHVESFTDGSVWTQIFLKRCQGRWGGKRLFWYIWTCS